MGRSGVGGRPSWHIKQEKHYWNALASIAAEEDRSISSLIRMAVRLLVEQKYPQAQKYLDGAPYDPSATSD